MTKGQLVGIGVGAAVVVTIAATAFFVLRPGTPEPVASDRPSASDLPAGPAPTDTKPVSGPWLRGTYTLHADYYPQFGAPHPSRDDVVVVASECPRCDATVTSSGTTVTFAWTGTEWQHTVGGQCPHTQTATPIEVVDGVVQKLTGGYTACYLTAKLTWTRTGD